MLTLSLLLNLYFIIKAIGRAIRNNDQQWSDEQERLDINNMKIEEYKEIKGIYLISDMSERFGFTMDKWEFKPNEEYGEMAKIMWIEIWKNDKKIAYIRQSNCNIYFK